MSLRCKVKMRDGSVYASKAIFPTALDLSQWLKRMHQIYGVATAYTSHIDNAKAA